MNTIFPCLSNASRTLFALCVLIVLSGCTVRNISTKPTPPSPTKEEQEAAENKEIEDRIRAELTEKIREEIKSQPSDTHNNRNSLLWVQTSAEYKALALTTYTAASKMLPKALKDRNWTASPEQRNQEGMQKLKPAIILDVDETVLDNSPYQARLIKTNGSYDKKTWATWCKENKARAVPGAVEFTQLADSKGVTVFYVTNRASNLEVVTRQNLKDLGFPIKDGIDVVLTKNERNDWTSEKGTRRIHIGKDYRILMMVGDNLGDFTDDYKIELSLRDQRVDQYKGWWGQRCFVLPNPTYGSWYSSIPKPRGEQIFTAE